MFSEKIFQTAVKCVESVVGLPYKDFMQTRKAECVDARSILVALLRDYGMREYHISMYMGLTQQCINKLYNNHHLRMRFNPILRQDYLMAHNDFTTIVQRIHSADN